MVVAATLFLSCVCWVSVCEWLLSSNTAVLSCFWLRIKGFLDKNNWDSIPPEIRRSPLSEELTIPLLRRRRHRRYRKQKRGKRGGIKAKLKANPHKPAIPSLFLANARSLNNNMDELRLQSAAHSLNHCVLVITETWLDQNIPDAAIDLVGRTVFRADRTSHSGKSKGGGLCIYTNKLWCANATVKDSHCSPDIEYLMLQCRPFYLPREFTSVVITAVYVPPQANARLAMEKLQNAISQHLSLQPDSIVIAAGDFNHANCPAQMSQVCKLPNKRKQHIGPKYTAISHKHTKPALCHIWVFLITCH